MTAAKQTTVLEMSGTSANRDVPRVEIIDGPELARRIVVPRSWVAQHVTSRYPVAQRIPCIRIGRYVRFRWGSPELNAWLRSLETR